MQPSDIDKLENFLAERGKPLLRTAKLLTGSQDAAEDLLQAALERLLKPTCGAPCTTWPRTAGGGGALASPDSADYGTARPAARPRPSWSTCATPWSG